MRLHRLTVAAIGPFADEQVVDFDDLTRSGIFLFEGPTGVGKSTLIDAITFALYGQLAGADSDPVRLRSHFAGSGTPPRAVLEFSVGNNGRYRITRTPEYPRPKLRGSGFTLEKASTRLERRNGDGSWQLVSSSSAEVGALIPEIVGLTANQFTQVVVLPQGEFAKFLIADDDARRVLLGRLFGGDRFDRITAWFDEQARQARAREKDVEATVGQQLAALAEAGQVADTEAAGWLDLVATWTPETVDRLEPRLAAAEQHLAATAAAATIAARRAAAAATTAADDQRRQHDSVSLLQDHQRLQVAVSDHRSTHVDTDRMRRTAARARSARSLVPLLEQFDAADATLSRLRSATESILGSATAELPDWSQCLDQSRDATQAATHLTTLVDLEAGLDARRSDLAECEQRVQRLAADHDDLDRRCAFAPTLLVEATTARDTAATHAARLPELERRRDELRSRLDAATRLAAAQSDHARLEAEAHTAIDEHQAAVDALQEILERRIAGMTAELADALVPGQPCAVCGALEHPRPATASVGAVGATLAVDPAAVDRARRVRETTAQARDIAQQRQRESERHLSGLREQAGGQPASVTAAELSVCETDLAAVQHEADRLPDLRTAVQQAQAQCDDLQQRRSEVAVELAATRATIAERQPELQRDEALVAGARDGFNSVAKRRLHLSERAATLQQSGESLRDLAGATEQANRARATLEQAWRGAGFADIADLRTALVAADDLESLEQVVAEWDRAGAELAGRLADPRFADCGDGDDLPAAQALLADFERRAAAAATAAQVAAADDTAAVSRLDRFRANLVQVRDSLAERQQLGVDHAPVHSLRGLTTATDATAQRRMTLTSYVLRQWFADVVAAANLRLARIAGGKYELRRTESGSRKTDRVGLGLAVLDRHTGAERSPSSLSGGERFYASLSLALGLSDVVTAAAGGVALDTLFLDEGFGTLDTDTLDDVLGVLDGLRENGRVIGIVSHVEALKERFPERLEIRRVREQGPSTLKVVA